MNPSKSATSQTLDPIGGTGVSVGALPSAAVGGAVLHEHAVIGAILLQGEAALKEATAAGLRADVFSDPNCKLLYRATLALHDEGAPLDALAIIAKSGVPYEAAEPIMDNGAPTAAHVAFHADTVMESAQAARLRQVVETALARLGDSDFTPQFVASELTQALEGIESNAACTGFDAFSLSELESYETPKDHIIAGNGMIRRKAGTLFTGGTGLGKSVACSDIAVWLAGGMPLFGCIPVRKPVRVLYLQAENDADVMRRDILSAVKHSGGDREIVQKNLAIQHVWGLHGERFHEHLTKVVGQTSPDVVIVDPYQSFVTPGDLNGTAAFLEWIAPVQRLMHARAFGLLLTAHTPKPANRQDWNARQMVYLAAGSSAISNWARASIELTTAEHETDRFRLTFGKNAERNGLTSDHGGIVRELFVRHSGNIHEPYWTVAENQSAPSKSKYAEDIVRLCEQNPGMSYGEIAKALGCSKSLVSKYRPESS